MPFSPRARACAKKPDRAGGLVDLAGYVVYCEGTTFLFRDGRLDSIRLADLDSDVFKNDRLAPCRR